MAQATPMGIVTLVVAATVLAGCGRPSEGTIQLSCPQWAESKASFRGHLNWLHNDTFQASNPKVDDGIGRGQEYNGSRPLDRLTVTVGLASVQAGVLRGTVAGADGRALEFFDIVNGRPLAAVEFPSGDHTGKPYSIALRAPHEAPRPQSVTFTWDFDPDDRRERNEAVLDYRVTYWHLREHCL